MRDASSPSILTDQGRGSLIQDVSQMQEGKQTIPPSFVREGNRLQTQSNRILGVSLSSLRILATSGSMTRLQNPRSQGPLPGGPADLDLMPFPKQSWSLGFTFFFPAQSLDSGEGGWMSLKLSRLFSMALQRRVWQDNQMLRNVDWIVIQKINNTNICNQQFENN